MAKKNVGSISIDSINLEDDLFDIKRVKQIIEENIEDISYTILEKFEETVSQWETEVIFEVDIEKEGGSVYTTNEVYKYVNDGTEPHAIVPNTASVLAFPTGYGGQTAKMPSLPKAPKAPTQNLGNMTFTKSVMHPGTEGKEYDKKVAEEVERYIDDYSNWFEELE